MKFKFLRIPYLIKNEAVTGIIRIMKISFIFLFIFSFQLLALNTKAQDAVIELKTNSVTVGQLINEIEKQTDYLVVYSNREVDANRKVDVQRKSDKVSSYLNDAFAGTDIGYDFENNYIVLMKKANRNATAIAEMIRSTLQQGKTITGKVVDVNGEPIIGANIIEVGTTNGTVTDIDGNFSLKVADNATIRVSYIGYVEQEINTAGKTNFHITLAEDTQSLEEVVVVGYGTMRKSDLTGAVAKVTSETFMDKPVASAAEAIAGQIAGVQIQQISGRPGGNGLSIRVRGTASVTQSNDPLYVVDGYPMEANAFNMINPTNIESIEVLKDASSTAIYGSRGANGVVMITTKKGKGKPSINLNMYAGFQQPERYIKMLNRDQYIDYFIDGRNNAWIDATVIDADPVKTPHAVNDPNSRRKLYPNATTLYVIPDGKDGYLYNFLDPSSVAKIPDNDWQELLYRNALIQNYEVAVSGGIQNTQYLFSANYFQQDGIMINTDFDRINLHANIDSQISNTLKVGLNTNAYFSETKGVEEGKYGPAQIALQLPPIFPVQNEDGTYGSMVRNYEIFAGDVASPLGLAEQITNLTKNDGWFASLFAEWKIVKDLNYKININGGVQNNNRNYYLPSYVDMDASRAPRKAEGENEKRTDKEWVLEQTLTYQKIFAKKHDLTLLGGYTTQKHYYDHLFGEARGFPNDVIKTLNAGEMYQLTSDESEHSMISYFGRVNYSFDNKYLFAASFRADGSSRFGKNNKWGTFPSLSLGWRLTEENFMKDVEIINDLKLRASYGIAGNNRIGNYSSIGLLNVGYYPLGDALQFTVDPSTMSNEELGWEKTEQVNLGFDLSLVNNRIRLEADFYNSTSRELLLNVPVPTITGYSSQMQNVGKVQNRGMEFLLNTKNLVNEFKWSSNFNISFNKNKVLEVGPDGRPIFASAPNASNAFITTIGHPIASFYGYVYEGVFMSQDELDKYPHLSQDKVGDARFRDVNKDGKLDGNDKTIVGDNHPLFTAGWQNDFKYKNFSLGILLTGSYGADVYSIYKRMIAVYHGDRNGMVDVLDRWRSPDDPGNGKVFRATRTPTGWSRDPSSFWVTDGSYLRIRNVTLSYDFPLSEFSNLGVKGLRVYLTGQNLYTFTKNPGYDPESSSEGSGLTKGGDYISYPTPRSFILGVNVSF